MGRLVGFGRWLTLGRFIIRVLRLFLRGDKPIVGDARHLRREDGQSPAAIVGVGLPGLGEGGLPTEVCKVFDGVVEGADPGGTSGGLHFDPGLGERVGVFRFFLLYSVSPKKAKRDVTFVIIFR